MENENQNVQLPSDLEDHDSTTSQQPLAVDPILLFAESVFTRQEKQRSNRRRSLMVAGAMLITVALVFVFVGAGGPNSRDAAAQVELGARATLAEGSTSISISGSFSGDGQAFPVSGTGVADFSTNIENLTMNYGAGGTAIQESILANGPLLYMQILDNSQNEVSQVLPGKEWVQFPISASATAGTGGATQNIASQLQLLESQGNEVVPLGSSTISGESVTGYQVTISHKAMVAATKRALRAAGTAAATTRNILNSLSLSPPVLKLWLGSNRLLAREEVTMNANSAGITFTGDITLDFSDYGTPISVSFPSSSQVASYSDFMAAATAASNSSS